MIRIIIFSDIRIYCEGLSEVLSDIDSIEVVGAESNFQHAVDKIEQVKPDVILLDMTMSGSCRAAKEITHSIQEARIVALAAPVDKDNVIRCAEAGIAGYVAREASLNELIEALKGANKGEYCYPPEVAAHIFNQLRQVAEPAQPAYTANVIDEAKDPAIALTGREIQISNLMSEGFSNKQIARELSIEVSTVKNHVHNILVKLDVKSRLQVVSLLQQSTTSAGSRSLGLDRKLGMSL